MDKEERRWVEGLQNRIVDLAYELVDLKRFYLAFKISQCKECNVEVLDWDSPIFFGALDSSKDSICKKHQKEMDEFNRRHASD